MASTRVVRCFLDVDLRLGHLGLALVSSKKGVRIETLSQGEFVMFLNRDQNKLKLYAANNVIAYLRLPRGHIDLRTIQMIPSSFHGGKIDYPYAVRKMLDSSLRRPPVAPPKFAPRKPVHPDQRAVA